MAPKPFYRPRDVDALIPQLETIFAHIDDCRRRASALSAEAVVVEGKPSIDSAIQSRVEFLLSAVEDDVEHIQRLGGIPKDLDQGLVDFPAQIEGQDAWLCWKRGEAKVRYWHALNQGFEERQTLRRSEPPPTTFH